MAGNWIKIWTNFAILWLLQVFVCDAAYFGIYLSVQIYVMFILFLPIFLSKTLTLLLSTMMGLFVDLMSGDIGLHMAACALMGYAKPFLLRRISTSDLEEIPPVNKTHIGQYLIYTGILIFLHHSLLFTLETFSLREIVFIGARTIVSVVFNVIMIGIVRALTARSS
jgi:hypothetical protein